MTTTTADIRTQRLPRRQLAYVRHVGPYMGKPALFERLFNRVGDWAAPRGFLQWPDMEAISVYHDDPESVPPEKQRISVGFTVPLGTPPEGDIQMLEIPAGNFVVGSFEIMPEEYGQIWEETFAFMGENKLRPSGLMYESYRNDPHQHPEGKHRVDACIAVEG